MVSHYEYTSIMSQIEYDYDAHEWTLPGSCFKDSEPDYILRFSTKHAAALYVYDYLNRKVG